MLNSKNPYYTAGSTFSSMLLQGLWNWEKSVGKMAANTVI
jgi:hypothetical protein